MSDKAGNISSGSGNASDGTSPVSNASNGEAIPRITSTEKIDQMLLVVDAKGWLALGTFIVLAILLFLWMAFGTITLKTKGEGILLRTGGLFTIYTPISGKITDIAVASGDRVTRGDVIARLEQPQLLSEMLLLRTRIENMNEILATDATTLKIKRTRLERRLLTLEERFRKQQQQVQDQKLNPVALNKTLEAIEELRVLRANLGISEEKAKDELAISRNKLQILQDRYQRASQIKAPYSGNIVEVKVSHDSIVDRGASIASMELIGKNIKELEGVIYVDANEGKNIQPGMSVLVSPTTIQAEEHGSLLAKVTSVSKYPTTRKAMMRVLGNEKLVDSLLKDGALVAVNISLIPDMKTESGYAWTSTVGPPQKIQSGTLCSAHIITSQRAPYTLIIPYARKSVGM